MTEDDKFFERLRGDAAMLRHRVDDATLARIRERIHQRIAPQPTVAEVLASWFRPLAAGLAALALAAAIGLTMNVSDASLGDEPVEIVMGGDTYRVGN
jgi:hypothetical protein